MGLWTFILSLVAMIFGFVYLMNHLQLQKKNGVYQEDETLMMQQLHSSLARMEKRIEALETLILDRDRAEAHDRALSE